MSKRKTGPAKAAQPVPAKLARAADVVRMPKVSDPPKFYSQNYPPDDLPEITQDELRALTEKPELSDEDIELIRREDKRANRKIGFFESLKENKHRLDAEARQASADATMQIAGIGGFAMHGAKVQKGRRRGVKKSAENRRKDGAKIKKKVLELRDRLIKSGRPSREIAGVIAPQVAKSVSRVRRILAADKKARTS